jgi:membrane protein required for colicin V production
MNMVDVIVLAVVFVSALLGLSRGLVRELLGVVSWAAAGYGAWLYGPQIMSVTQQAIGNPDLADPAAYVLTFVVLLVLLSLISNLIGRLVGMSALGSLDRTLGLVFGLARGAAVLILAYIPLAQMLPPDKWPPAVQQARTLWPIYQGALWAAAQAPAQYRPRVPPPPDGRPTTSASLLQATPEGSALGPRLSPH